MYKTGTEKIRSISRSGLILIQLFVWLRNVLLKKQTHKENMLCEKRCWKMLKIAAEMSREIVDFYACLCLVCFTLFQFGCWIIPHTRVLASTRVLKSGKSFVREFWVIREAEMTRRRFARSCTPRSRAGVTRLRRRTYLQIETCRTFATNLLVKDLLIENEVKIRKSIDIKKQ